MEHSEMEKNKGFTLIEVMVTLVIAGILVGMAAVSFHQFIVQQRLEGAANQIYADLKLAQSEAIKRNKTVFVSFKPGTDDWCYGISVGASCECDKKNSCQIDGVTKVVKNDGKYKGTVLQQARFAGNTNFTAFDPRKGYAQAGSLKNGTVWLKSSYDDQLAVIVNRLGRVRFCSPTIGKYTKQCPKVPAL